MWLKRFPPLQSLNTFYEAGRLASFSRAAEELCLTPSAVSHQIKALEQSLGVRLFYRSGRRMLLTEPGQKLHVDVYETLTVLARSIETLRSNTDRTVLKVVVAPTFAQQWLMPKLAQFMHDLTEVELRIVTAKSPADYEIPDLDIGIRYGSGNWSGFNSSKLFTETLVPFASPSLELAEDSWLEVDGPKPCLIYTDSRVTTWQQWILRYVKDGTLSHDALHFDRTPLAIKAAVDGLGIVLESPRMAEGELRSGALTPVWQNSAIEDEAYYVITPYGKETGGAINKFLEWMHGMLNEGDPGSRHIAYF